MKKRKTLATLLSLILFAPLLFSCSSGNSEDEQPSFSLTATVKELGEKILIDVSEGEYASGPYLMIISDETEIVDKNGAAATKDSIALGDEIRVIYNGQVMMSYPAQIVARKIQIK